MIILNFKEINKTNKWGFWMRLLYKIKICIRIFQSDSFQLMRVQPDEKKEILDIKIDRFQLSTERAEGVMYVLGRRNKKRNEITDLHDFQINLN